MSSIKQHAVMKSVHLQALHTGMFQTGVSQVQENVEASASTLPLCVQIQAFGQDHPAACTSRIAGTQRGILAG